LIGIQILIDHHRCFAIEIHFNVPEDRFFVNFAHPPFFAFRKHFLAIITPRLHWIEIPSYERQMVIHAIRRMFKECQKLFKFLVEPLTIITASDYSWKRRHRRLLFVEVRSFIMHIPELI